MYHLGLSKASDIFYSRNLQNSFGYKLDKAVIFGLDTKYTIHNK